MNDSPGIDDANPTDDSGTTNIQMGEREVRIPAGLAEKLAKARVNVGAVAKNGRNNDQNYSYVQAEDVVREAGRALAAAKVVVRPAELVKLKLKAITSRGGGGGKFAKATFTVTVTDGETGEGFTTRRVGTATDYPGDKAIYKAETGMMKYFLASLLQMPLGDGSDPETTRHDGPVNHRDTRPASDKQKQLFKKLIAEKNLPPEATRAIVEWIGGTTPRKGKVSHALEQLLNGPDPLEFARECGWKGEIDDRPAETPSAPDGEAETVEAGDAGEGEPEGESDPDTPLSRAIEDVSKLGFLSEFGNVAWLLFDTENPAELTEEALQNMLGLLERANRAGIRQPLVATCVRAAREGGTEVGVRAERFEHWITEREKETVA